MTRDQFIAAGAGLYGAAWQRELARALGQGERAVRHYAAGSRPIPEGMADSLRGIIAAKVKALQALRRTL